MFVLFTLKTTSCSNGTRKHFHRQTQKEWKVIVILCVLSWYNYFCYGNVPFKSSRFVFYNKKPNEFNSIVCFLRCPDSRNKAGTYPIGFYIQNEWNGKLKIHVSIIILYLYSIIKYVVNCVYMAFKQKYLKEEYFKVWFFLIKTPNNWKITLGEYAGIYISHN